MIDGRRSKLECEDFCAVALRNSKALLRTRFAAYLPRTPKFVPGLRQVIAFMLEAHAISSPPPDPAALETFLCWAQIDHQ
jgi:hypothetical protein